MLLIYSQPKWVKHLTSESHDILHSRPSSRDINAIRKPPASSQLKFEPQEEAERRHQQPKAKRQRPLHVSKSFTQGTNNTSATNRFTRVFARHRKSLIMNGHSASLPSLLIRSSVIEQQRKDSCFAEAAARESGMPKDADKIKGIVSAIIDAASRTVAEDQQLGWVGVEEEETATNDPCQPQEEEPMPPPPPIENDPHIFDLLAQDDVRFINYSKRDGGQDVMSSATVEKLVEKLTREMGTPTNMNLTLTQALT